MNSKSWRLLKFVWRRLPVVVGMLFLFAAVRVHGQFEVPFPRFTAPVILFSNEFDDDSVDEEDDEEDDEEQRADPNWTVESLAPKIEAALDRHWDEELSRLRVRIAVWVDEINATCRLTESQRQRLSVAAKGLVARCSRRGRLGTEESIRQALNEYREERVSSVEALSFAEEVSAGVITYGIDEYVVRSATLFWKRALRSILTDSQQQALQNRKRERAARRHNAHLEQAIGQLDRMVRLTRKQEAAIRRLVQDLEVPDSDNEWGDLFEEYEPWLDSSDSLEMVFSLRGKQIGGVLTENQRKLMAMSGVDSFTPIEVPFDVPEADHGEAVDEDHTDDEADSAER